MVVDIFWTSNPVCPLTLITMATTEQRLVLFTNMPLHDKTHVSIHTLSLLKVL